MNNENSNEFLAYNMLILVITTHNQTVYLSPFQVHLAVNRVELNVFFKHVVADRDMCKSNTEVVKTIGIVISFLQSTMGRELSLGSSYHRLMMLVLVPVI
jgi:hypothetical protein